MTIILFRMLAPAALLAASLNLAHAQVGQPTPPGAVNERLDSLERDTNSFFGRLFGRGERNDRGERGDPVDREEAQVAQAQMSPSDVVVRLDRLENQIRQLTGLVEQLQYRNQQLEQMVRRMDEPGSRAPDQGGRAGPPPQVRPQPAPQVVQPGAGPQRRSDGYDPADNPAVAPPAPQQGVPRSMQRRGDVFDPNENPNAPGAPRVLGSLPSGPNIIRGVPQDDEDDAPPRIGAPGGRQPGAPLDLSTLSERAANDPALGGPSGPPPAAALPPPPPRMPSATGGPPQQTAMLPPGASPKDEYDLAYGYVLRKDYALAEESFRGFLSKHPNDRLVADANYWLGETLFQRQRYRDAAESFLTVSTKYEKSAKAPDSLLRLGQSLAALREKEAACATFVEIGRKYPRASPTVKQGVEREQKRVGC
jgi:tol-pal system protein YbgF